MASVTPPPPRTSILTTPVAILAAGALIGLGLFFGLRREADGPAPSVPATLVPSASTTPSLPLGPGPIQTATSQTATSQPLAPTATATTAVDKKAIAAELKTALDQHKKMIVEQCVAPSLAKKPTPDHVNLSFNISVDANGKQVARGVSEDRETSRADVTQCVQSRLPALSIAPPGAAVFVEGVAWTLP